MPAPFRINLFEYDGGLSITADLLPQPRDEVEICARLANLALGEQKQSVFMLGARRRPSVVVYRLRARAVLLVRRRRQEILVILVPRIIVTVYARDQILGRLDRFHVVVHATLHHDALQCGRQVRFRRLLLFHLYAIDEQLHDVCSDDGARQLIKVSMQLELATHPILAGELIHQLTKLFLILSVADDIRILAILGHDDDGKPQLERSRYLAMILHLVRQRHRRGGTAETG